MEKNNDMENFIFLVLPPGAVAMGVCKDLYSDNIPHAVREERTVVIVFQTKTETTGKKKF